MNYVMSLDIDDFILLIDKAFEKKEERKAWEMWLMRYQHMDKKTFMPFSKFYKNQRQSISTRSSEEILAEAEEIRTRILKKEGG